MKTKQTAIRAKFTAENSNARNRANEKETIGGFKLICRKTEAEIVDVRFYMGRGSSASTVYCSIWVTLAASKKPADWEYWTVSGSGQAGGYGYDKRSSALEDAIESAGIQLFGDAYARQEKPDFKKRARIGGAGVVEPALCAIAYAAGFPDCIMVEY